MDFLQSKEWGLMILDGKSCYHIMIVVMFAVVAEVQTIPADKFRRALSGINFLC